MVLALLLSSRALPLSLSSALPMLLLSLLLLLLGTVVGMATVATMSLEQAEFKVDQVHMAALMEEFPFVCTIEPAS